ncbi:MAG: hypothetical protein L0Z47_07360 [Actinobacteria bacterium]|nr:hypothetical protein [Actinomycetota bacterium]MCI0678360.1 hypothetical protein [Actinomycetota bacterium]
MTSRYRIGIALLIAGLVGCGGETGGDTVVLIAAAASLTDVFAEMERVFELEHPDLDLVVSYGVTVKATEVGIVGG